MPTAVFDMLGTFFSLEPLRQRLSALGAPDCALELWFAEALRDHFAFSHAGAYAPLSETLAAALPRTLEELGRGSLDRSKHEQVLKGLSVLNPADGAQAACSRLLEKGWRLVALTNGSEEQTRALLDRAGLLDRFDDVLSADQVGTSKPHPDVYNLARQAAGPDLWMVASHAWDIAGARRAGLRTLWISRKEKRWLDSFPRPDLEAPDLASGADAMLAQWQASAGSGLHA